MELHQDFFTEDVESSKEITKQHSPHDEINTNNENEEPKSKARNDGNELCSILLVTISVLIIICLFPFSIFACVKVVQEYERAIIFRLGRICKGAAKGSGIFLIMPCIDDFIKVDLRTVTFQVPPQEILTKDGVTISVDAVVYYCVHDAILSIINVENADGATRLLAQTTLRNMLGTKNLHEVLSDRELLRSGMQASLNEVTVHWGIKVERVEIKDVRLPIQLQRAMASEAEASRDAKAKVIAAEGEMNASRKLKEAADIMGESPNSMQLRYLQTLTSISAEKNSTIVFPIPIDMISNMLGKK